MSKDKRWNILNDPGIMRKKADAETDLLIFGYACKIFRDDQKALEMDQGKHLIPWMGDETLKIDRYDARGHLSELSQFEGTNQDYVSTAEERRIEQICDEERYRALNHNEEEQEMYQEEELKRLKQALSSDKEYGQVAYQYENDKAPPPSESAADSIVEEEEPFVPSPSLFIPADMTLPSSVKENQIIEKTAAHIASHGPQVEILIKTRQANNQKLNFLHVGSPLNPFYNFILSQIKTGRYKPAFMIQQEAENNQDNDDHYLHPSLAPAPSTVESAPSIPSIAYKPSVDCSYNLLVNKIRNMQRSQVDSAAMRDGPSTSDDSPTYCRKRRKRHSPIQAQLTTPVQKQLAVPPQHVKEIISRLINFAHSRDLHPSEIASTLLKQDSRNLGFVEPGHKYHDYYLQQLQETYKENIYNLSNPSMEAVGNEEINSFDEVNTNGMVEEDSNGPASSRNSLIQEDPVEASSSPVEVDGDSDVPCTDYDVPSQPTSKPAPVCFSIKKPKERLGNASAFPMEESPSEEGADSVATQGVNVEGDRSTSTSSSCVSYPLPTSYSRSKYTEGDRSTSTYSRSKYTEGDRSTSTYSRSKYTEGDGTSLSRQAELDAPNNELESVKKRLKRLEEDLNVVRRRNAELTDELKRKAGSSRPSHKPGPPHKPGPHQPWKRNHAANQGSSRPSHKPGPDQPWKKNHFRGDSFSKPENPWKSQIGQLFSDGPIPESLDTNIKPESLDTDIKPEFLDTDIKPESLDTDINNT